MRRWGGEGGALGWAWGPSWGVRGGAVSLWGLGGLFVAHRRVRETTRGVGGNGKEEEKESVEDSEEGSEHDSPKSLCLCFGGGGGWKGLVVLGIGVCFALGVGVGFGLGGRFWDQSGGLGGWGEGGAHELLAVSGGEDRSSRLSQPLARVYRLYYGRPDGRPGPSAPPVL